MPLTGAKERTHSTSAQRRTRSKRVSNDSGLATSTPSGVPATREERKKMLSPSTNERVANNVKLPSSHRTHQSTSAVELSQPSSASRPRRKIRRVESWLKEQQRVNDGVDAAAARHLVARAAGTPCNPYLAYPGLSSKYASLQDGDVDDDDDILGSFVIVEEEEPEEQHLGGGSPDSANNFEYTANGFMRTSSTSCSSSTRPSSLSASRPASVLSVSPWRNLPFTKTLPVRRYPSAPGEPVDLSTPTASLRIGSARRRSPIPEDFLNADGPENVKLEKAAQNKASSGTLRATNSPRSTVKKRLSNLMRPNGFSNTNLVSPTSTKASTSPRPSISASATTATTSTAVENDLQSVGRGGSRRFLPKFSLNLSKAARQPAEDIRLDSPTRSSFSTTVHSEEPVEPVPLPEQTCSHPDLSIPLSKRRSQQNILYDKRHNASSSALSTLSIGSLGTIASNINGRAGSVFSGASTAKRKRLVVSGIEPDNTAALQGLRRWCERFGELRQITRMPNGDLHIDFKRAEVADTVCRISARVHIAEVGSVNLSWISGRRH